MRMNEMKLRPTKRNDHVQGRTDRRHHMSSKKTAQSAKSFSELEEILGENALEIVKKALDVKEKSREYHKKQYLKRQLILIRAREAGITGE